LGLHNTVFTSIFSKLFIKSVKFKIFTNAVISQPFFLIVFFSGSVICHSFGKERDVKIDIDNPVFRKDGSVSMKSTLAHQIKIPNSFMGRIEVYDKAQYEPISICHFYHKLYLLNPAPTYIADRVW
jgi:hypothetical protein